MKTKGILNAKLAGLIAGLGHKDEFMIVDCGMPIPQGVEIVDMALNMGIPEFIQVLEAVLKETNVEHYIIAKEISEKNTVIEKKIDELLVGVEHSYVSHEELKKMSGRVKFVIRSGEATPFANILLQSGVAF